MPLRSRTPSTPPREPLADADRELGPITAAGGELAGLRFAGLLFCGLVLGLPSTPRVAAAEVGAEAASSVRFAAESRARIAADLEFLSADSLAGRNTGSEGIDQAAEFLSSRFAELGLNTALFDGTPFQEFTALTETAAGPADQNHLSLRIGDEEPQTIAMDQAMRPLALGVSGRAEGPLVFAGYGITAPEHGYDDYAGLDTAGKIVVVLRGEPRGGRPDNPLGGPGPSRFAYFATKVANANAHGAAGLLIVNRAEAVAQDAELAQRQLDRQLARLSEIDEALQRLPSGAENSRQSLTATRKIVQDQLKALRAEVEAAPEGLLGVAQAGQGNGDDQIPVASLGRRAFARWIERTSPPGVPRTLDALERGIATTMQPQSFAFDAVAATLQTSIETRSVSAKNVIAELPGRGPLADETVVIGAHYDHVGMGGAGSLAPGTVAIHNGADDNGSGTAILLELARRLSTDPPESMRRIVFIAFTAEEKGLLGSKHYVRQPRFPLEQTVAMVNLDMVGRLREDEGLTIYGTGTAEEFDALVDRLNEQAELPVRKEPSGYGPSDHNSFYEKQIPVLFFFTGLHTDYHRPSDDFEKINLDGMVRITDMVTQTARHLATVAERPSYTATEPGGDIRVVGQGAYLGVQLRTTGDSVVLSEVLKDSPAATAGLRPGDHVARIGDNTIDSMTAVQEAVGSQKPGDVVEIEVLRSGQKLRLTATLGERP